MLQNRDISYVIFRRSAKYRDELHEEVIATVEGDSREIKVGTIITGGDNPRLILWNGDDSNIPSKVLIACAKHIEEKRR